MATAYELFRVRQDIARGLVKQEDLKLDIQQQLYNQDQQWARQNGYSGSKDAGLMDIFLDRAIRSATAGFGGFDASGNMSFMPGESQIQANTLGENIVGGVGTLGGFLLPVGLAAKPAGLLARAIVPTIAKKAAAQTAKKAGMSAAEKELAKAALKKSSRDISQDTLKRIALRTGIQEGITGAAYGTAEGMAAGEDASGVAKNALLQTLLFGGTGGAVPVLGKFMKQAPVKTALGATLGGGAIGAGLSEDDNVPVTAGIGSAVGLLTALLSKGHMSNISAGGSPSSGTRTTLEEATAEQAARKGTSPVAAADIPVPETPSQLFARFVAENQGSSIAAADKLVPELVSRGVPQTEAETTARSLLNSNISAKLDEAEALNVINQAPESITTQVQTATVPPVKGKGKGKGKKAAATVPVTEQPVIPTQAPTPSTSELMYKQFYDEGVAKKVKNPFLYALGKTIDYTENRGFSQSEAVKLASNAAVSFKNARTANIVDNASTRVPVVPAKAKPTVPKVKAPTKVDDVSTNIVDDAINVTSDLPENAANSLNKDFDNLLKKHDYNLNTAAKAFEEELTALLGKETAASVAKFQHLRHTFLRDIDNQAAERLKDAIKAKSTKPAEDALEDLKQSLTLFGTPPRTIDSLINAQRKKLEATISTSGLTGRSKQYTETKKRYDINMDRLKTKYVDKETLEKALAKRPPAEKAMIMRVRDIGEAWRRLAEKQLAEGKLTSNTVKLVAKSRKEVFDILTDIIMKKRITKAQYEYLISVHNRRLGKQPAMVAMLKELGAEAKVKKYVASPPVQPNKPTAAAPRITTIKKPSMTEAQKRKAAAVNRFVAILDAAHQHNKTQVGQFRNLGHALLKQKNIGVGRINKVDLEIITERLGKLYYGIKRQKGDEVLKLDGIEATYKEHVDRIFDIAKKAQAGEKVKFTVAKNTKPNKIPNKTSGKLKAANETEQKLVNKLAIHLDKGDTVSSSPEVKNIYMTIGKNYLATKVDITRAHIPDKMFLYAGRARYMGIQNGEKYVTKFNDKSATIKDHLAHIVNLIKEDIAKKGSNLSVDERALINKIHEGIKNKEKAAVLNPLYNNLGTQVARSVLKNADITKIPAAKTIALGKIKYLIGIHGEKTLNKKTGTTLQEQLNAAVEKLAKEYPKKGVNITDADVQIIKDIDKAIADGLPLPKLQGRLGKAVLAKEFPNVNIDSPTLIRAGIIKYQMAKQGDNTIFNIGGRKLPLKEHWDELVQKLKQGKNTSTIKTGVRELSAESKKLVDTITANIAAKKSDRTDAIRNTYASLGKITIEDTLKDMSIDNISKQAYEDIGRLKYRELVEGANTSVKLNGRFAPLKEHLERQVNKYKKRVIPDDEPEFIPDNFAAPPEELDEATESFLARLLKDEGGYLKLKTLPESSSINKVVTKIDKEITKRTARLRERMKSNKFKLFSGVDPGALRDIEDVVVIGALKIAKQGLKFPEWSASMLKDLGNKIKPHLSELWGRSNQYLRQSFTKSQLAKKTDKNFVPTYPKFKKVWEVLTENKSYFKAPTPILDRLEKMFKARNTGEVFANDITKIDGTTRSLPDEALAKLPRTPEIKGAQIKPMMEAYKKELQEANYDYNKAFKVIEEGFGKEKAQWVRDGYVGETIDSIDKSAGSLNEKIDRLIGGRTIKELSDAELDTLIRTAKALDNLGIKRDALRPEIDRLTGKTTTETAKAMIDKIETESMIMDKDRLRRATLNGKDAGGAFYKMELDAIMPPQLKRGDIFIADTPELTVADERVLRSNVGIYENTLGVMRDVLTEPVVHTLRNASTLFNNFSKQYERLLFDIVEPIIKDAKARERVYYLLEGKNPKAATDVERKIAKDLREKIYNPLFKSFGIENFVENYAPRLHQKGIWNEITSKIGPKTSRQANFFADMERKGLLVPTEKDAINTALAYIRQGGKSRFVQPTFDAIDKEIVPMMSASRKEVYTRLQDTIMHRPVWEQRLINTTIGKIGDVLRKELGIKANQNFDDFTTVITRLIYTGTIAYNPMTALKNITQLALSLGTLDGNISNGVKYFAKAVKAVRTEEGKKLLKFNWVGQGRQYLEGQEFQSKFLNRFLTAAETGRINNKVRMPNPFGMLQKTDKMNVNISYMMKVLYALDRNKSLAEAVSSANKFAGDTQFLYGMDSPLLYKTSAGKLLGVLMSWPVNFMRLMNKTLKDSPDRKANVLKVANVLVGMSALQYGLSQTGLDFSSTAPVASMEGWLPIALFASADSAVIPLETAKTSSSTLAALIKGDPEGFDTSLAALKKNLTTYIPYSVEGKRLIKFYNAAMNDWKVENAKGQVSYTMTPKEAALGLVGSTTANKERSREYAKINKEDYNYRKLREKTIQAYLNNNKEAFKKYQKQLVTKYKKGITAADIKRAMDYAKKDAITRYKQGTPKTTSTEKTSSDYTREFLGL